MKAILFIYLLFHLSIVNGQKSVRSVVADGYIVGQCNNLFMSATIGQIISGTSSCGSYDVVVGYQQPSSDITTKTQDLGINKFNIYPNPAIDLIMLKGEPIADMSELKIRIIDIIGREVIESKIMHFQGEYSFDISHLTPGFYTMVLSTADYYFQISNFIKNK
jgi:hypothetical protein